MFMQINLAPKSAQKKMREPLVEGPKQKREIPDWLKVLLVRNSCYSINFWKVAEDAGMRTQFLEFAEMHCNREREERLTYGGMPNKRVKGIIAQAVEEMMGKASDGQILDWLGKGYINIYRYKWERESVRRHAIIGLANALGKDIHEIRADDFRENGLDGLLGNYYNNSPYTALVFAGYNIRPWDMDKAPQIYNDSEARIQATRWLVKKTGKDPRDLIKKDFDENGLRGIMPYYNDSPYKALRDAGFEFEPWEMKQTPAGFFDEEKNRVAAVRWLVIKSGKKPEGITQNDFRMHRLFGLLLYHYSGCPHLAVVEAGFQVKPWEMDKAPLYDTPEKRAEAVKWLAEELGKPAREIIAKDFYDKGLSGVLARHQGSPYSALLEAGMVTEADEEYMRSHHHTQSRSTSEEMGN